MGHENGGWMNSDQRDSVRDDAKEIDELRRLAAQAFQMAQRNTILRKIAAHVPAKVWIEAKEKAGFGTEVSASQLEDPKLDEAWMEFISVRSRGGSR